MSELQNSPVEDRINEIGTEDIKVLVKIRDALEKLRIRINDRLKDDVKVSIEGVTLRTFTTDLDPDIRHIFVDILDSKDWQDEELRKVNKIRGELYKA
ncbi:hypothetical protein MMC07_008999, partial [Pseudocyphellaria aurata]|nr:hypothetical protein [Pseudocyphellaria aurata]